MNLGKIVVALLAIWVLFIVIGIVFKALFWLFVIGLIALGFTLAGEGRRRGVLRR